MAALAARIPARRSIIEGIWAVNPLNMELSVASLIQGVGRGSAGNAWTRTGELCTCVYMPVGGDGAGVEAEEGDGGSITTRRGVRS